ncbi:MAG: hypothetical protein WA668_01160 [Candidatus Cybelea sp.]
MTPGAEKIKMLVYVSATSAVCVYDYQTGALTGMLTGFTSATGQCVDKRGNVWVTDLDRSPHWKGSVSEYAHGKGKRLKTLSTNGPSAGCSVDPTSGNLAVANQGNLGQLLIFKKGEGTPTRFQSSDCGYIFSSPGFDDDGNLFVEDSTIDGVGNVCELPHGSASIRTVNMPRDFYYSGGNVMWDGKYITFSGQYGAFDYRTAIYQMTEDSSGNLTPVGETVLNDDCEEDRAAVEPFIVGTKNTPANRRQGKVVVGADGFCATKFGFWSYPAGGLPDRAMQRPKSTEGISVSIAE